MKIIIKFNNYLYENFDNINNILKFKKHMENVIEKLISDYDNIKDDDLEFKISLKYKNKNDSLSLSFNADIYEEFIKFLDFSIKDDDDYNKYKTTNDFNI